MKILILGGDKRYDSLKKDLEKKYDVDIFNRNLDISNYDLIIFPISGVSDNYEIKTSKGLEKIDKDILKSINKDVLIYTGIITDKLKQMADGRKIVSFLEDEDVKRENNDITTDGIVEKVKENKPNSICILGYGNLGKILFKKLDLYELFFGLNNGEYFKEINDISFFTSDKKRMKNIFSRSDYIINTVPQNIIDSSVICSNMHVLDVASSPFGASKDIRCLIDDYNIYSGIPGKYSPDKAGKVLSKKLLKDIGG